MSNLTLDSTYAQQWIGPDTLRKWAPMLRDAEAKLVNGAGEEPGACGWLVPEQPDSPLVQQVLDAAEQIRETTDVFLVIGVGGSYLGARAAIDMLGPLWRNQLPQEKRIGPEIYFIGHNLHAGYIRELLERVEDRRVTVNVISKSGTTTEPAIAFRLVREWMIRRYGVQEAKRRTYVTTDGERGALRELVRTEGYPSFDVPADIGGRYSVLTAVGLLPLAVSGIEIRELLAGAGEAQRLYANPSPEENICHQYAAYRNELYQQGKSIELMACYEPQWGLFSEWWKQLVGESEGKDGKGLFPGSVQYPADLHSIGQWIQEGPRHLFETVLWVEEQAEELAIPHWEDNLDGLNYLSGASLHHVNRQAFLGALQAHRDGGVPNLVLRLKKREARHVGHLFYFFMKSCAISGYLLGVNPFDQPGVEAYKQNMFRLLGKL